MNFNNQFSFLKKNNWKLRKFFLIMKLSTVILLIATLQIMATGYAQNVSLNLNLNKMPLREVFKEIERQSELSFIFSDDVSSLNNEVSVNFHNRNVKDILNQLFKDTDLGYQILNEKLIIVAPMVMLQGITITGTVIDNAGEPLPGVNVVVKGTNIGVISNANGKYSITAPNNDATLVFSFVGYTVKEVAVAGQQIIDITLSEDVSLLEEVVVVGYGSVKKTNLTGAVGYVDSKQLENRAVPTLGQALQGKVAGLNIISKNGMPGAEQTINIRGYTGLGKMASPLLVIDGVQGGSLNDIEMNDVESISFLKDAASSAIYGSSAPYGVILVTTKKGRVGKPTITYNNNFGFSKPINLPHWKNSEEFADIYQKAERNTFSRDFFSPAVLKRIKDYRAGTLKTETQPLASADNWEVRFDGNADNDNFDYYFNKVAFSQRHNIGVSGATESTNYYVGLGYTSQEGMLTVGNETDQRYNARVNVTTDLTKWLSFSARTSFSRAHQNMPAHYGGLYGGSIDGVDYSYQLFHSIGREYPNWPRYQPDGNIAEFTYLIGFVQGGRQNRYTDNSSLTGEFVVKPLPGWEITGNYTYANKSYEHINHASTFYATMPSGALKIRENQGDNSYYRNMDKTQDFVTNIFTTYQKSMGDHFFSGTLGFVQHLTDFSRIRAMRTKLISDEVPSLSLAQGTTTLIDNKWEHAQRGAFGRIQYNFKEKYLLEVNGRYDGTSKYMKDYRMKFYPGVSAAWTMSRESFWEPLTDHVNMFKLRASYASLGNQTYTGLYDFYPGLKLNVPTDTNWLFSGNSREISFRAPDLVNYAVTWVTTTTLDFGFDIGALNNRFELTFDWYRRLEKDFIGVAGEYPALLGTSPPGENNTDIETKGWEISIGWRDRIGEFSYGANFKLWDYQGTVLKFPNPNKTLNRLHDGQSIGEIWGWETVGIIKTEQEAEQCRKTQRIFHANWDIGDIQYKNNGEVLTRDKNTRNEPGDQILLGNVTPRFHFGFNLNAEWKGFDASVFLQGIGKRDVMFHYASNYFWGCTGWGSYQSSVFTVHDFYDKDTNPNGYLPRPTFTYKNGQPQTRYLQSGAYMRLKNLQLGYTIPKSVTDKIKCQKARIFVNGENLITFTKLLEIVDPEILDVNFWDEYNSSSGKAYPLRRIWSFGLNVTF